MSRRALRSGHACFAFAVAAALTACGARSPLRLAASEGDGGQAGSPTTTTDTETIPPCGIAGDSCIHDVDCCDLPCANGVCTKPPPPCMNDQGPVLLLDGLADPYSLGGDATSLYVGQLDIGKKLLRIPKAGGPATALVDPVSFIDFLTVQEGQVFYSDEDSVRSVPTGGGSSTVLAKAFGPAGFAITPKYIYLAEYFAQDLVQIERSTLIPTVLHSGFPGIYRVAATDEDVYFSTFDDGLYHFHVPTGSLDVITPELGEPRAVLLRNGTIFYTVPFDQRIFRLKIGSEAPELVADLSSLGQFPEALQADGTYLYTTLVTGEGPGLIVRVPIGVGSPDVITEAGGFQPSALVVDDDCVYWTERDSGSVFRARKIPGGAP